MKRDVCQPLPRGRRGKKKENRKCSCNTMKISRGSKGAGRAPETTQFFKVDWVSVGSSFKFQVL